MVPSPASGQVRGYYVDWRMLRDVKRRKMAYEYADERLRINSLRKNTILPKDLQVSYFKMSPYLHKIVKSRHLLYCLLCLSINIISGEYDQIFPVNINEYL